MSTPVYRLVLDGLHSWFVTPPVGTGGTVSARYCYSVFMRHRVIAARNGLNRRPASVVELGPGDSLGIGLMALLTGTERYCAIDAVRHASPATNQAVFDGLVTLLRSRAAIPEDGECAEIRPVLENYAFPSRLFDDETLQAALAPARLEKIRKALQGNLSDGMIQYLAPWGQVSAIPAASVDWVLSQAVMEHVDDPEGTYRACLRCLRSEGMMSHQIDYRSHETAPEWNGHWKYPRWLWGLMRGRRPWFINRLPHSTHLRMLQDAGFTILEDIQQPLTGGATRRQLARQFTSLSESDLKTAGAMIVASHKTSP